MKGIRLNIIPAICLLAISMAGCNSNSNKQDKQDKQEQAAATSNATIIRNDELYPFMLAGVYFVHGYGGPERTFDGLIKPATAGEPGSDTFSKSIQAAYSRYFIFPFKPEDDKDGKEAKATLADYWDIHNTAELEKSLDWLLDEGHQAQYAQYRKVLDENGGAGADLAAIDLAKYKLSKTDVPGIQFVKDHYTEFSKAGIKAWDIARYINNICVAYQAGYFNRGEATAWLRKAPPVVQLQYSDWKAYFNDFLLGRQFWGGSEGDTERFRKEVAGMLEGKYSIYTYMPVK
ncbi:DUF1266 domain-containing protein [Chitinophaga filiformis]|uniref:DUF1266 domain-containing protein n=1 Tax=Chitinophaga filiformis TaxID=104663 RepID=A0A1G7R873_CHIFI|nr:DUF1266 domain-containing protein [Chitinophaga filiformis]SDG06962.1 Protein of unknown function [Chitinophaga filiformis]